MQFHRRVCMWSLGGSNAPVKNPGNSPRSSALPGLRERQVIDQQSTYTSTLTTTRVSPQKHSMNQAPPYVQGEAHCKRALQARQTTCTLNCLFLSMSFSSFLDGTYLLLVSSLYSAFDDTWFEEAYAPVAVGCMSKSRNLRQKPRFPTLAFSRPQPTSRPTSG